MTDPDPPAVLAPLSIEALRAPPEVDALPPLDLSDWFGPFVPQFLREALEGGGEAWIARQGDRIVAALLTDPAENLVSVFSRSQSITEGLVRRRREEAVYAERDLPFPREVFDICVCRLDATPPTHRFRHPVRIAGADDIPEVRALLREVYGSVPDRWVRGARAGPDSWLVVEADGQLVGAAAMSVVGTRARFHSLTVRAGHRRMGVARDLLFARRFWAEQCGARLVFSEISERNAASRAVAERGGMRPEGRIYLYRRA